MGFLSAIEDAVENIPSELNHGLKIGGRDLKKAGGFLKNEANSVIHSVEKLSKIAWNNDIKPLSKDVASVAQNTWNNAIRPAAGAIEQRAVDAYNNVKERYEDIEDMVDSGTDALKWITKNWKLVFLAVGGVTGLGLLLYFFYLIR